jgi:7-keto-8-aminopelargonate synthetase-like enzyme
MLRNLIRNAIDYTPAGGSVFATSRRCGSERRIEVRLTGLSARTAWDYESYFKQCLAASHYVQPINYPTVPRSTERLRITPTPWHTDSDIDALVKGLVEVCGTLTLRRAA